VSASSNVARPAAVKRSGLRHLLDGEHLHSQVVEGTGSADAAVGFRNLDQYQLQGRVSIAKLA
jgi:hypothetical protein